MQAQKLKAHILLFTANLIYGLNYTIAKGIMPTFLKPLGIILLRVSFALPLFWLFHKLFVKEKVDKKDIPKLILCGLFGVSINQIMFFVGLNYTTPINSAIILTATPLLVLPISALLIKERITSLKIAGLIIGAIGAIILVLNRGEVSFNSETFIGNMFTLINAVSYAVYLVMVKPMMKKYNPITILKWVFFFGLIFILPITYNGLESVVWSSFSPKIWFSVFYILLGATFLAYLFIGASMTSLSPNVVGIYIYLQPFFATISSLFVGTDTMSWDKIVSTLLIFFGSIFGE